MWQQDRPPKGNREPINYQSRHHPLEIADGWPCQRDQRLLAFHHEYQIDSGPLFRLMPHVTEHGPVTDLSISTPSVYFAPITRRSKILRTSLWNKLYVNPQLPCMESQRRLHWRSSRVIPCMYGLATSCKQQVPSQISF